jgi:hypothetical protein
MFWLHARTNYVSTHDDFPKKIPLILWQFWDFFFQKEKAFVSVALVLFLIFNF